MKSDRLEGSVNASVCRGARAFRRPLPEGPAEGTVWFACLEGKIGRSGASCSFSKSFLCEAEGRRAERTRKERLRRQDTYALACSIYGQTQQAGVERNQSGWRNGDPTRGLRSYQAHTSDRSVLTNRESSRSEGGFWLLLFSPRRSRRSRRSRAERG